MGEAVEPHNEEATGISTDDIAKMMQEAAEELGATDDDAPAASEAEDTLEAASGDDSLASPEGDDTAPAADADDEAEEKPNAAETGKETPTDDKAPKADEKAEDGEDKAEDKDDEDKGWKISLNADERAEFDALPPEAQAAAGKFLERREGDMERAFQRKTQDVAELRRDFQPLHDMMKPHRDAMARANHTPFTYLKELISLDQMATNNPVGYIEHAVKMLKIDKADLAAKLGLSAAPAQAGEDEDDFWGNGQAQQQQPVQQPAPAANPQQQQQTANTSQNADVDPALVQQVQEFASAVDERGVLKHPHFSTVRADMAQLAPIYPEDSLADLYAKACIGRRLAPMQADPVPQPQPAAQPGEDRTQRARAAANKAMVAQKVTTSTPAANNPPNFAEMDTADILKYHVENGG